MKFYAWFTESKHSVYGAAITRIILGFTIAVQAIANFADRHYTWGDGTAWTTTVREAKQWPAFLDIMFVRSGGWAFDVAYIAIIAFGLLLMAGICTRAVTVVTLLLWMSLYIAHPFVGSGGDSVLRMVLLYLCFMDSGRQWSVDAWLRERRGAARTWLPTEISHALHNTGVVLILHQIIVVYVMSALWKVQSERWMDGTAVYYPLQVEAYSPWRDHIGLLTDQGWIMIAATYASIAIQLFLPVLVLYRPSRVFALLTIMGMHLGIGLFMGILFFSLVMIAADALLISDASWRRIADVVRGRYLVWRRRRARFPAKIRAS